MSRKRRKKIKGVSGKLVFIILIIVAIVFISKYINKPKVNAEATLETYMSCIANRDYEKMYDMLSSETKQKVEKDTYLSRNKNIYEGIEISNLNINIIKTNNKNNKKEVIYQAKMQTVAGEISFNNTSYFNLENEEYKLDWSSTEIFPDLKDDYKIRVETIKAERGKLLDRNGTILAGKQTASQIGLVPGKMHEETKESDIEKIAELLDISEDSINSSLSASYVKEDTFVPLKTIRKTEQSIKNQLLEIKGIMITDTEERIYPLGEATSHLLGYVQRINEEELEEKQKVGYNENSFIGKTGLEKTFEDRIRAINGAEIYILDSSSNKVKTLAKRDAKNGEDIKLTIDSNIQKNLYEQFQEDKSASVAMNPKTGEILALVSTPTFDSNDFSLGLTTNKWNSLSQNEDKPLFNRFLASYAPGSSMKPVTGAVGLSLGSFTADEDFGRSGTKWQKDKSWGDFYISTLTTYSQPANLQNALIYSDNIYFAKATIKIGKEEFAQGLRNIGFGEIIEFPLSMEKSSFSNNGNISSEQQLANSGYGQAEVLVNPIHMAMVYSSFVNEGSLVMPYLEYKEDTSTPNYYKKEAFEKSVADEIKEDLIQVVEDPNGTAHSTKIQGLTIAGKTGTAEIKASKDDKNGTEIGWFNSFIADESSDKQLLIISMVEDVKGRGGSHYLLEKIKSVYENF